MIEIKGLTIAYGSAAVLEGCSLSVPDGAHISLMGPSGCGKTTLLRAIAGLERPQRGDVCVTGRISAVFQEPRLLPWLTAEDNISIVMEKGASRENTAHSWLERAGLADSAKKHPRELSGGMQQRISICRALCAPCDILLLDEPFKGLDDARRQDMLSLIGDAASDKTIVLVTHDLRDAKLLTDTVYDYKDKTFVSRI